MRRRVPACCTRAASGHAAAAPLRRNLVGCSTGKSAGCREPSPHHSNGIDVPMKRQVWLAKAVQNWIAVAGAKTAYIERVAQPPTLN